MHTRKSIGLGITLACLLVVGAWPLGAQTPETPAPETLGPTTQQQGPTREAQAATVLDSSLTQHPTPHPSLRYQVFQRGFQRDFGPPAPLGSSVGGLLGMRARLEQKWGDTTVYQWIERGLAAYGWFRASTSMERRGFDIRMDTDNVAQGKLGVQMTRPLGDRTAE